MPSPRSPPNSLLEPSCGFLRVSRGLLRALFGGIRVLLALSWASPAALVGGLQSFLGPFSRPSFKAYRVLTFSLPSGGGQNGFTVLSTRSPSLLGQPLGLLGQSWRHLEVSQITSEATRSKRHTSVFFFTCFMFWGCPGWCSGSSESTWNPLGAVPGAFWAMWTATSSHPRLSGVTLEAMRGSAAHSAGFYCSSAGLVGLHTASNMPTAPCPREEPMQSCSVARPHAGGGVVMGTGWLPAWWGRWCSE